LAFRPDRLPIAKPLTVLAPALTLKLLLLVTVKTLISLGVDAVLTGIYSPIGPRSLLSLLDLILANTLIVQLLLLCTAGLIVTLSLLDLNLLLLPYLLLPLGSDLLLLPYLLLLPDLLLLLSPDLLLLLLSDLLLLSLRGTLFLRLFCPLSCPVLLLLLLHGAGVIITSSLLNRLLGLRLACCRGRCATFAALIFLFFDALIFFVPAASTPLCVYIRNNQKAQNTKRNS
jgi:hypothetical protein